MSGLLYSLSGVCSVRLVQYLGLLGLMLYGLWIGPNLLSHNCIDNSREAQEKHCFLQKVLALYGRKINSLL